MREYAQTTSKKVDYHTYPSGNKVIKAYTADEFVFFDKVGNTLKLIDDSCLDQAHKVRITWRIQKNVVMDRRLLSQPSKHITKYVLFAPPDEWYFMKDVWASLT